MEAMKASGSDQSEFAAAFERACPADVLRDEKTMRALNLLAKRIFTIQTLRPKYAHVAKLAIEATQTFLQCKADTLEERKAVLEQFVLSLPANARHQERLLGSGYSPLLFQSAISTYVNLETLNVQEEAFRAQLLDLYTKYTTLLQERKIQSVNGVALAKLFDSLSSLEQLQGERALVARALTAAGPNSQVNMRR
jgi:hypothetical protein